MAKVAGSSGEMLVVIVRLLNAFMHVFACNCIIMYVYTCIIMQVT